jgi:hypothetical protein
MSIKKKKILTSLVFVILILSVGNGCSSTPGVIEAEFGKEFTLSIGQEANISGGAFKIGFEDVIEDSRCPLNVFCVWEGRANILARVSINETGYRVVLSEPGLADKAMDILLNHALVFHLEPHPQEPDNISKDSYRMRLTVYRNLTSG